MHHVAEGRDCLYFSRKRETISKADDITRKWSSFFLLSTSDLQLSTQYVRMLKSLIEAKLLTQATTSNSNEQNMSHMICFILGGEFHSRDSSTYSSKPNTIKAREKRQAALKTADTAEYEKAKANDRSAKRNLLKKLQEDDTFNTLSTEEQQVIEEWKIEKLSQKRFEERKSGTYFTIITFHRHINVSIAEWFEGEIEKNGARSRAIFQKFHPPSHLFCLQEGTKQKNPFNLK